MAVYSSMQELVGNTPIVKLDNLNVPNTVQLFAKLELYNRQEASRIGRTIYDC